MEENKFNLLLNTLKKTNTKLVAVSKYQSIVAIEKIYSYGQRAFGENKVQDLVARYEALPKDIEWHLIGHLQSNKVKYIAPFVAMIQSVDSIKLLDEINKQAQKNNRIIPCLLQIHVAEESEKFGFSLAEIEKEVATILAKKYTNITINGLMGMATNTTDKQQIKKEFMQLKTTFQLLKNKFFFDDECFCEISMGMSADYTVAIEENSTIVRIGSLLF